MQRDKRGRFVKKAQSGMTFTLDGKQYKVKPEATQAFTKVQSKYKDINEWLATLEGQEYLEAVNPTAPSKMSINNPILGTSAPKLEVPDINDPLGTKQKKAWEVHDAFSAGTDYLSSLAPEKIKYSVGPNGYQDSMGRPISVMDIMNNPHRYQDTTTTFNPSKKSVEVDKEDSEEDSAGMNFKETTGKIGSGLGKAITSIDKNKLADYLEYARAGIGASINNKIAERALEAEKPFLQDVSESHRSVYGDYRSKIEGEKAAAKLRNMASKPLTSDGALQQQMMMEAQIKGQEYIDQGNAKDDALIRQTGEVAWQQEKENQQQRAAVAMQNKQAMLMTEKNKAQIRNMRDSANFSQIVSPLLAAKEQRLRNKGTEQEYYQDYYNDALVQSDVYTNFRDGLTDVQKSLVDTYQTSGIEGLEKYITDNNLTQNDWIQTQRILNNEVIRRKAALKGAYVNPASLNTTTDPFKQWMPATAQWAKKGGTIYKARLTKRTRDNDRGARSIESSRKIAARFLEKAIDSLYTYNDVELIAKPKRKKRKYQAGGGLPFVGFTPVFATSEKGVSKAAKEEKTKSDEDLTTKDILTLLKDMDGLPSDMQLIVSSLQNFALQDKMDPLGLSSSSDIASRYISLINKVKVAQFNRDEYNNAFNQLKSNGGLNELAVTSEGYLIGTNKEGDFEMFTPDQVNAGEPKNQGYSLLTNSNLLYLRANSLDAAFNHRLTTFAQSGIGMEVITKQVNDIIQSLGKSKESEDGFIQMGSNSSVKKGVEYLRKAMSELGDDSLANNMSIEDFYQAGFLTEDQASQAKYALQYIWNALPNNAKSLLQVKGGSERGAEALIQSLVYAKTSTDSQFKVTPKKMTKTSNSGSGSGSEEISELTLTPVQMMQVGYTDHMPVVLQKGTKYATRVNAQVLPITDVNKKLLGITTLDQVAESTFGGALDMNNVTMGSQLIDPQALQNVQVDSTNLYVMNLPIDKSSIDGTIKPDLSWMTKIEEIDRTIREQGITDIDQINKLYTDAGLPVLMKPNGQLNLQDYCKFGVLNGHALNSAFKEIDLLDDTINEIDDENQIENVLSILNKGRDNNDRINFDSESWFDSIFGTKHDSIFEGTIYIPIRTNAFTGMIGGGEYPEAGTAEVIEALEQQKIRTRGYVDPGLLNN